MCVPPRASCCLMRVASESYAGAYVYFGIMRPTIVYAMTIKNSSSVAMKALTVTLPWIVENVEKSLKYASSVHRNLTASNGNAASTTTKIRFSPAGILLNSVALFAARATRHKYMTRKMMIPALSSDFPSFCVEISEDVESMPPTMHRTRAAEAGSWTIWMKRLRRDTAVVLLVTTFALEGRVRIWTC